MNKNPDIIPIHVFANSANQAEMLNGQLRAHGLAVKPLWRTAIDHDETLPPELVFYFADTDQPSFDEVLAYAASHDAPLLVVARKYDAKAAEQALSAGAADWLLADHDALLAAAAQRARHHRNHLKRIRHLEEARTRDREFIERSFSHSEEAIATLSEGIFTEANSACAKRFGHSKGEDLVGQPAMDLLASASQAPFKKSLKQLLKKGDPQELGKIKIERADNTESEVALTLETFKKDDERLIRMRIAGENTDKKLMERIDALEEENRKLTEQVDSLPQHAPASNLHRPGDFVPLASQALGHAQAGAICALAIIRPAKARETRGKFGVAGTAELSGHLGEAFSSCLEEGDLATLGADLTLIAVITRKSEADLEKWLSATLKSLGSRVFEGGEYSGHLGFVAGYTVVNRIRQLDPLIKQAEEVATGESGSISKHQSNASASEIDDDSWEMLIREALKERRYTVLLEPVEDLSSGSRIHVAQPCLIDRDGKEIQADNFQPPAARLGLLAVLEHRFVGHALRALLAQLQDDDKAGIVVPLHRNSVSDKKLLEFLSELVKHTSEKLPTGALTLELDVHDITGQVRNGERFVKHVQSLNCAAGLRNYMPSPELDKLVDLLPIERLRLAKSLLPKLDEDNKFCDDFQQTMERFRQKGINVIATGVNDSSTMAHLYNLGISTIQGPTIGEAELFGLDEDSRA